MIHFYITYIYNIDLIQLIIDNFILYFNSSENILSVILDNFSKSSEGGLGINILEPVQGTITVDTPETNIENITNTGPGAPTIPQEPFPGSIDPNNNS